MVASAFAQKGTITHFIYIKKENRSFDSYFGSGFPGVQSYCQGGHSPAKTVCYAPNDSTSACQTGDTCPYPAGTSPSSCGNFATGGLAPQPLLDECVTTNYHDISHTHDSLLNYVDGGAMDNFKTAGCASDSAAQTSPCGYVFFDKSQFQYYYSWASTYGLADNFFSGMFPSEPAHMYMFAASSNGVSDNASGGGGGLTAGGQTCQTGPNAGNTCSCSGSTCNDTVSCGVSTPQCSNQWASAWTCEVTKSGSSLPFTFPGHEFSLTEYSTSKGSVCLSGPNAGASCSTDSQCPQSFCTASFTQGQATGLYCTSNNGTSQPGPVSCATGLDCTNSSYPQCRGTGFAGGVCFSGAACACFNSPGFGGDPPGPCSDLDHCGSAAPTCYTTNSQGLVNGGPTQFTAGAPCPQLVTIGDQMDSAGVSWKYYSSDANRNSAAMFATTRYGYCSASHTSACRQDSDCSAVGGSCVQDFSSHVPVFSTNSSCTNATCGGENQFFSDAASAAGWCSNNHATSCSIDSQCSAGATCVDNSSTTLPTVSFVQAGTQNPDANEHPANGPVSTGEQFSASVLNAVFSNYYLYSHSVIVQTYDDSGGFWDHVPPPNQNGLNLGVRVPLIFISPYARNSNGTHVNHLQYEYGSVLKCIETLFDVPHINSRDQNANDLCFGTGQGDGMLDLSQSPIPAPGTITTSTALTSSANPSVNGQALTLTATVTTTASGTPTGTINFYDGTSSLGIVGMVKGTASLAISSLSVGTHSITAVYSGDSVNQTSTGTLSQVVMQDGSTTTIGSSLNPSSSGQNVVLTATVTAAAPGAGTPTGTVVFSNQTSTLGSGTITNGAASINVTTLPTGTDSITGTYGGDSNFTGSTSGILSQVVNKAPTSAAVTSNVEPAAVNQSVTYTATVASSGNTATGSVTLQDGSTILGTFNVGQATFTTSYTKTGTHPITAIYSGDSNNQGSTSPVYNQYIETLPVSSTTTVSTSGSPSLVNTLVTFTAKVTSTYGIIPNGEVVTFYDGTTQMGNGKTSGGIATFSTATLSAKTHTIKATYAGDSTFKTSTGSVQQIVNLYNSSTALSSSPNPSAYGQSVLLTATVTSSGSPTPTGQVTFYSGTSSLGTATLTSTGTATLSTTKLNVGSSSLSASYNGDSSNGKSTSPTLTQTVNAAQITLTLSSSPNPSTSGTSVKFTATVTSNGSVPNGQQVTFTFNGTTLGTATISKGSASLSTTTLPVGSDSVTATFAGNSDYNPASASETQVVN